MRSHRLDGAAADMGMNVKIISGGQTGVDRAALDVAVELEIPHGGWCPKGRLAEDGRIPDSYKLRETTSREYAVRTEQNVLDSDGTLILYRESISGGTELTLRLAEKHRRKGLGRQLLQHAIARARETGCHKIELCSDRRREEAHHVYRAVGFKESASGFRIYF